MSNATPTHTRTTSIRTLDDLHESNLQELVQYANDNPAAVPGVFVGGGFSEEMLAERRREVWQFDSVIAPRVWAAVERLDTTPWFLKWLPASRRAERDLVIFARRVLDKIDAESSTGLEQFGPIKRAVNNALHG